MEGIVEGVSGGCGGAGEGDEAGEEMNFMTTLTSYEAFRIKMISSRLFLYSMGVYDDFMITMDDMMRRIRDS